jgi:hypothetical protein
LAPEQRLPPAIIGAFLLPIVSILPANFSQHATALLINAPFLPLTGPFLIRMDRFTRTYPLDRTYYLLRSLWRRHGSRVPQRLWLLGRLVSALRCQVSCLEFFPLNGNSYGCHGCSVLAANSVLRSLFGVAFPLFTTQMYHNLGVNWASTLVAFLSLACAPLPM